MLPRFLIAVCVFLFAGSALAQKRVALLVGNQDYKRGVGKLVNPLNDIRIVGDALRKVGFDVLEPVKNGTRIDILDALQRYTDKLKDAGPNAIGFVYYSGHGIASKGANYLIPVEVERPSSRQLRAYGLKQGDVLAILRKDASNAAHYVVIDACRNELKGARGSKGFLPVNQQSGTLIAFATAPGQTTSDIGDQSGPYAKALAAEIVKPGVNDLNMFHSVRVAVSEATDGDQVPWTLDGIQREERPFFAGKPQQKGPFSDALATRFKRMKEAAPEWKQLANTTDRKKLQDFAKRYSGTGYDSLALAKLAAMDRKIIDQVSEGRQLRRRDKPPARDKSLQPGQTFRDCSICPEMVVVPSGSFAMGSKNVELNERPVRKVNIANSFAVGKYEVTFAEWDACVADRGCFHEPGDEWGRGRQPVTNVTPLMITKQFLPWLSWRSGKTYRLLTEAEWEYAARANSTTKYAFGNTILDSQAQFSETGQGIPALVGSFEPNAFGLYDMHGNVWEWVQDCYKDNVSPSAAP